MYMWDAAPMAGWHWWMCMMAGCKMPLRACRRGFLCGAACWEQPQGRAKLKRTRRVQVGCLPESICSNLLKNPFACVLRCLS